MGYLNPWCCTSERNLAEEMDEETRRDMEQLGATFFPIWIIWLQVAFWRIVAAGVFLGMIILLIRAL